MKAPLVLLTSCVALLALLPHADAAEASALLNGQSQVPPLNTVTSGYWNATLAGNRMEWMLEVMDGNRVTMAHIHQGGPADNGPVIVFLVPVGVGSAATTQALPQLTQTVSGDRTFTGSFTAADIGGLAAGKSLQDLIALFQANQAYVNVHDEANPAGVVRGQVEWAV